MSTDEHLRYCPKRPTRAPVAAVALRGGVLALAALQLACSADAGSETGSGIAGIEMAGSGGAAADPRPGAGVVAGAGAEPQQIGMGTAEAGAAAGSGVAGGLAALPPGEVADPGAGGAPSVPVGVPIERTKTVDSFVCPGGHIGPGNNTLMVNGRPRTLVADFPADPNARMGILFSWHGYNQAEGQHRTSSKLDPNGNPALPVVVITPDDVDFELPVGLDWQLDEGSVAKNVDLQLFEAMVGCLNEQYDIDPTRIYSLGYSAGSVMSSLIHSVYPQIVSAVICISGMWFNDPKQVSLIIFASSVLKPTWPALRPEDGGTVLLTHGGLTDIAAGIVNLEAEAQAAIPFLAAGGRAVIDCAHNSGHTGHPEIGPAMISKFISEHSSAGPSPYRSGGYGGFPGSCMLRLP